MSPSPLDPEQAGRAAAEALLTQMARLKQDVAGPAPSPERDAAAGALAVEAMKHIMGDLTRRMQPPEQP